jgi:hypothetical protein
MSVEHPPTSWPDAPPVPLSGRHDPTPTCSAPPIPQAPCPVRPRLEQEFEPWRPAAYWQAMHQRALRRQEFLSEENEQLHARIRSPRTAALRSQGRDFGHRRRSRPTDPAATAWTTPGEARTQTTGLTSGTTTSGPAGPDSPGLAAGASPIVRITTARPGSRRYPLPASPGRGQAPGRRHPDPSRDGFPLPARLVLENSISPGRRPPARRSGLVGPRGPGAGAGGPGPLGR